MNNIPLEVQNFLTSYAPFDQLPAEVFESLASKLEIDVVQRGVNILTEGDDNNYLFIVRSGAIDLHQGGGVLLARLSAGATFGSRSLLSDAKANASATATDDTVLYKLPSKVFLQLCQDYPPFRAFFYTSVTGRLHDAVTRLSEEDTDSSINLLTIPVAEIISRQPVTLPPDATISSAARLMAEHRISSILVVEDECLRGIVTDRDLRSRVIAAGVSYEWALSEIMTPEPLTVEVTRYGFEALLKMAKHHIHHLPVMKNGQVTGMLTATDLLKRCSTSDVYLVNDIYKRDSVGGLTEVSAQLPRVLLNLVEANASAHGTGHVISSIGEAVTCRLLQLAEEKLGPPPVPYAWLAGGSLGRLDQTGVSDQDNCLLLADTFEPEKHADYFKQLSKYVCYGLNACGYVYCPGEVMAMNPQWRQPLATWKRYFAGWIDKPEPKALMLSCIFFDLRTLYGDHSLLRELSDFVLTKSKGNSIFLAYMTANALAHQPPLGFFRNFVMIRGGDHDHTLDLKHNGVVPIIDLARIYSLAHGIKEVNTLERLEAAVTGEHLSHEGAADLRDALEFISTVRLQHQAKRIRQGKDPNNFISPSELSHFDRTHLKDAFAVVRTMQATLAQRYQAERIG